VEFFEGTSPPGGSQFMDRQGKEKSSLGNDSKLNREKNKVTGVKTIDQISERKSQNDTGGNRELQKQG
jgi:hypothetical protein